MEGKREERRKKKRWVSEGNGMVKGRAGKGGQESERKRET